MKSNITLVCDSVANIPKELLNRYNIKVVSLTTKIDNVEYKDVELDCEEFYTLMKNSNTLPKTSQATYIDFIDVFNENIKAGNKVLYISASSKATGTYQSAMLAKNDVDGEVYIFDSLSLSFGCGMLVVEAAKMIENGLTIEEILDKLHSLRENSLLIIAPSSLDYLQKGGRLSTGKAMIGTMLNIKPILLMKDGLIVPELQVRGSKKVISSILKLITDTCGNDFSNKTIGIGYGDNKEEFEKLKEAVEKELKPKEIIVLKINSSICSHTGPSILGVTCLK